MEVLRAYGPIVGAGVSVYSMITKVIANTHWLFIIAVIAVIALGYPAYDRYATKQLQCEQFKPSREGFQHIRAGSGSYKVHEDLSNPEKAAEIMNKVNDKARTLIDHLVHKYVQSPSGKSKINPQFWKVVRGGIVTLKKNFKSANLEENLPERSGGDTSYVINKGDVFAMCLRDPNNGNRIDEDMNNLVFVLVHELTHLFTTTYGHDTLFWNNFKFILEEAVSIGIYSPVDYKRTGSPYCGITITYSPIFDKSLKQYHKL